MKFDKNTAATVTGYMVGAGTAALPVINAVQGSFHAQDWVALGFSIFSVFFGHKASYN